MKAIVLAAGRGSRMHSLTAARPKCLVEFNGASLLSRQIQALRTGGATEIAIVTGYRREMLGGLADHEFHNPRWAQTNMVSSLASAAEWLKEEPCVVSYSDIFYEADAVSKVAESRALLAVAFDPNWQVLWTRRFGNPLLDAETFRISAEGEILEIGRRPSRIDEIDGQFMGLLKFTPEGWHELDAVRQSLKQETRDQLDMTGVLQLIIARGNLSVKGIRYCGDWDEVDSAQDLSLYQTT